MVGADGRCCGTPGEMTSDDGGFSAALLAVTELAAAWELGLKGECEEASGQVYGLREA